MRRRQILGLNTMAQSKAEPQDHDLSDDEARRLFTAKFGKAPHWKMKRETILERLNGNSGVDLA